MALFPLPYKYKIISRIADALGTGFLIRVHVLDASGLNLRKDVTISASGQASWEEIQAAIRNQMDQAFVADAGSQAAFLDRLVTDGSTHEGKAIFCARKTADQAFTTTAFANCNDLLFTLAPSLHYKFSFVGAYTAAATTIGLQLSVTGPASPTSLAFMGQIHTGPTVVFGGVGGAYDVAIAATAGSTAPMPFRLEGSISTGAVGGVFQLRVRSEVNASAITILRGSIGELIAVDG